MLAARPLGAGLLFSYEHLLVSYGVAHFFRAPPLPPQPIEFTLDDDEKAKVEFVQARERLIRKIRKHGMRPLIQAGCGQRILQRISRREFISRSVVQEYEEKIKRYELGKGNLKLR